MRSFALVVLLANNVLSAPQPDPEVVGSVVSPVSFGALYTGIHNVDAKLIPGTVAYGAPSLVYYGRKKRDAEPDPDVVGSVVHPISFGPYYTGIHKIEAKHIPGTVTYGAPQIAYYGRKKRNAEPSPDVVGSVIHPISYGALYTGIHNVETTHIPGSITYGTPSLVYYGRKKREAEANPGVVGSVVSPVSYGALYTGIHNVDSKLIPGTVTYGNPAWLYYGRK